MHITLTQTHMKSSRGNRRGLPKPIPKDIKDDCVTCETCDLNHNVSDIDNINECKQSTHCLKRPCFNCGRIYTLGSFDKHNCNKNINRDEKRRNFKIRRDIIKKKVNYLAMHGSLDGFEHPMETISLDIDDSIIIL